MKTSRADYLRQFLTGSIFLFLLALMVSVNSAVAQTNLAAGKSVTATSQLGGFSASNATDGSQGSYWESQNGSFPQTLTVDLGSVSAINRVVLKLPAAWETRTQTLSVSGSVNGSSFSSLVASTGYVFNPVNSNVVEIPVTQTDVRYVRLSITANTGWAAAQLAEFEVYGASAPVGSHDAFSQIRASAFNSMNGIDTEPTSDAGGGRNIGWIDHGDWVRFENVNFGSGASAVNVRVASDTAGGTIEFRLDSTSGPLIGALTVNNTGGWQNWVTASTGVSVDGVHDLYLVFTGSAAGGLFNVNWLQFTTQQAPQLPATPANLTVGAVTASTVALSWSSVSLATHYDVLRNGTIVGSATTTSYTDAGLSAQTTYQYAVQARNAAGSSASSSNVSATTAQAGGSNPEPPEPDDAHGATLPYDRYATGDAVYGGGAILRTAPTFIQTLTASEAYEQRYVALPGNGAFVEWTVKPGEGGAGVTMRFTMPDSADGMGLNGSLNVHVNGSFAKTIPLTSYYNYQYFNIGSGHPSDAPGGGNPLFRFDEVHWLLDTPLQPGDVIRIVKANGDNLEYGVDFIEVEQVPAPRPAPANAISVTDFGAVANDGQDDLAAFNAAVNAAVASGRPLYIPAGTFHLSSMWQIGQVGNMINNITITGAGIWHTNIQFTNPNVAGGGISFRVLGQLDFSHVYMNSMLRSRYHEGAIYKAFMDNFGTNSRVHNVWVEHFECGFWVGDYAHTPAIFADGLVIEDSRIRNNLADGVNFAQGTRNSTVRNSNIRNNGDDGLAVWTSNVNGAPAGVNNSFINNTIEFNWRAAAIAFFGGSGHRATHNLIVDGVGSSALRMNTVFPGYHFQNNTGILFSDTTIIRSGTSIDAWGGERGAIDLEASNSSIRNVTFRDINIYNTQRSAVQMGYSGGFENIVFENIVINGTGLDGVTTSRFAGPHPGAAIYSYTGNGTARFTNLTTSNVAHPNLYFIQPGFNLIID